MHTQTQINFRSISSDLKSSSFSPKNWPPKIYCKESRTCQIIYYQSTRCNMTHPQHRAQLERFKKVSVREVAAGKHVMEWRKKNNLTTSRIPICNSKAAGGGGDNLLLRNGKTWASLHKQKIRKSLFSLICIYALWDTAHSVHKHLIIKINKANGETRNNKLLLFEMLSWYSDSRAGRQRTNNYTRNAHITDIDACVRYWPSILPACLVIAR